MLEMKPLIASLFALILVLFIPCSRVTTQLQQIAFANIHTQ